MKTLRLLTALITIAFCIAVFYYHFDFKGKTIVFFTLIFINLILDILIRYQAKKNNRT